MTGALIGIALTFEVPDSVTFEPEALDSAMAALGWDCDSQCDHMSFAKLSLRHTDLGLATIEAATFSRHLAKWFSRESGK